MPNNNTKKNRQTKKILLIEDEAVLVDLYKIKFEKEGYNVEYAYDGKEGIEKAKKLIPELVLLDIVMPKIDGYQVLKELRRDPKTKNIIIYILSNLGQNDEIKEGLNKGADGYFVKANLTPMQLVDYVDTILLEGKKPEKVYHKENIGVEL